jgi:hypothetical protein
VEGIAFNSQRMVPKRSFKTAARLNAARQDAARLDAARQKYSLCAEYFCIQTIHQ